MSNYKQQQKIDLDVNEKNDLNSSRNCEHRVWVSVCAHVICLCVCAVYKSMKNINRNRADSKPNDEAIKFICPIYLHNFDDS